MSHLSWQDARSLAFATARASQRRALLELPLSQASGTRLAVDVTSPIDLPHYDSSAMDGYAVAGSSPWQLVYPEHPTDPKANRHKLTIALTEGQATPVLTGGLIPPGTSAVIRSEHTRQEDKTLYPLAQDPAPGADIRRAGEEVTAGDLLVSAGTLLTARHIALLAVSGIDRVTVAQPPQIACAFTGNEVIEAGIPAPGEVRDAYAPQFPFLLQQLGAKEVSISRLHDDMAEVATFFEQTQAGLILVTGGSADSEADILRRYLKEVGARFVFGSIAVRPGHPTLLAELADGRLVLGLPGNPLAAHTSLFSLVPVLIAGWTGGELPPLQEAQATSSVPSFTKQSIRLLPALVTGTEIEIFTRATSSHMLSALARGNALAIVAPSGVAVGEDVSYLRLDN